MTDRSHIVRRVTAFGVVAFLHVAILAGLRSGVTVLELPRLSVPARLILERHAPPEPPRMEPAFTVPSVFVPMPEIVIAAPLVRNERPVVTARLASRPGHFGAANDAGLGLDVGTVVGGGSGDRGRLADFEADVRRQILAGKRQPTLAWDRRNTCVVGYVVQVASNGRLAGFSIDPCAVPELNEAARVAVRNARYPPPPGLGAASYEVHGNLIFRPR